MKIKFQPKLSILRTEMKINFIDSEYKRKGFFKNKKIEDYQRENNLFLSRNISFKIWQEDQIAINRRKKFQEYIS